MCRPCGEGLEFFIDAHAGGKVSHSKLPFCESASFCFQDIVIDPQVFADILGTTSFLRSN
jgi:hypothetical protein